MRCLRDAAQDAIARRSMFKVVQLARMLKVDIYVLTSRSFDRESFRRRAQVRLDDRESARGYLLDTPEDTILHKLEWYRAGGEVSERQWSDVIGVLQVQLGALDLDYLSRWASELGVADLLERALDTARREE